MTEENQNQESAQEPETAIYVAPQAPFLRIPFSKTNTVKFENGKYATDDPDQIALMDDAIKNAPSVKRWVKKVDMQAGLAIVEAHKKSLRAQGIVGAMNTDHLAQMRRIEQEAKDAELAKVAADPEAAAKLKEQISDTMLTEPGIVNPPEPDLRQSPPGQPETQPENKPEENTVKKPFEALKKKS